MKITAHAFTKKLLQFLVIPWTLGKFKKSKHRKHRSEGYWESKMAGKGNLYHSITKKTLTGCAPPFSDKFQQPFQLCLFLSPIIDGRGEGKRNSWEVKKKAE